MQVQVCYYAKGIFGPYQLRGALEFTKCARLRTEFAGPLDFTGSQFLCTLILPVRHHVPLTEF